MAVKKAPRIKFFDTFSLSDSNRGREIFLVKPKSIETLSDLTKTYVKI